MRLDTYNNGIRSGVIFVPANVPTYLALEYVDPGTPSFVVRLRLFVNPYIECDVSQFFDVRPDAMTELDRLAALISGEAAPVGQGWVKGAPPEDGQWYLAMHTTGAPVAIRYHGDPGAGLLRNILGDRPGEPWRDISGAYCAASTLTHHLPTPIQPPKETP